VPEGDTIAWSANRIRPVLEGRAPDEIWSLREPRWPERLARQAITRVNTYGKHLFLHFEGGLVLHSHLGMVGKWLVRPEFRPSRRAWIALRAGERWVVELDGPTLELLTEGRVRFDQRLAGLGPDVLADGFDAGRFLARLRADDPTRPFGDALLDQRNVAGIGNIWKAEGCWEAQVDPWQRVAEVPDADALAVIEGVRPRMQRSAVEGPRAIQARVHGKGGRPCPRCGGRIMARGQGDANRITYWCPNCQNRSRSEFAPAPDPASSTK
jgi:endonuclease VIII